MVDIVERLREKTKLLEWLQKMGGSDKHVLVIMSDAADEIERLREDKNIYAETIYELEKDVRVKNDEIERLREALKDIDGQMRQADRYFLKESTLAALQQKDSE